MELLLSIRNGQIEYLKKTGCCSYLLKGGTYIAKNTMNLYENKEQENPVELIKACQGVLLRENKEEIEIYCDPFCSIPLYYFYKNGAWMISASFAEIREEGEFTLDPVGAYELFLYGNCIHNRTLFKEIKQFPAASVLRIKKATNKSELDFYWNFQIEENKNIRKEEEALDLISDKLRTVFALYYQAVKREKKPVKIGMGLSGGLDSRMSLCLMSEIFDREEIQTFTFGYHKKILEYKFAKKTAKKLKQNKPRFYKLIPDAYVNSFELAQKTGGEIGIHHSHIYSYLKENKNFDLFLSNYYSDAVMGWDAKPDKEKKSLNRLSYYNKLHSGNFVIDDNIKTSIKADIESVADRYDTASNFSGLEEFFYVVERNPKFHVKLSYQYNNLLDTILPYADYELLCKMISVPLEYRYGKRLEEQVISRFMNLNDISSRRYFERSTETEENYNCYQKIYYGLKNWEYHKIDAVNRRLRKISGGRFALVDPFKTEDQLTVLIQLYPVLKQSVEFFTDKKILSQMEGRKLLDKKKISSYVGEKFNLISMWIALQ